MMTAVIIVFAAESTSIRTVEDVGHIAFGTAAEELDELLIGDGDRLALQHDVREAAEDHHAREGGDEGRDMDIGYPEGLPGADQETDEEHHQDDQPHIQVVAQQDRADGTDKADHRADRQIDVAAGENAEQHTGCQHEHVGVLGDDVGQVLGQKKLAVGAPGEKRRHQHKRDDHGVLLNKCQNFRLTHCLLTPLVQNPLKGYRP